ncbi:MAG: hypothetical protein LIQ31_04380, partial [Planctomycetes bacterium]|nr:hypothetical protein [Planctomycetota bacterium]
GAQPVAASGTTQAQAAAPMALGSGATKPVATPSRSENTSNNNESDGEAGLAQAVHDALRQAPSVPVEAADIMPQLRDLRAQDRQVTAETLQLMQAQAQEAAAQGGGGGGGGASPADSMEMLQQELMLIEQQIAQVQKQMNGGGVPQIPQASAGESTDAAEAVNSRLALSSAAGSSSGGNRYPPPVVDADGHVDGYM